MRAARCRRPVMIMRSRQDGAGCSQAPARLAVGRAAIALARGPVACARTLACAYAGFTRTACAPGAPFRMTFTHTTPFTVEFGDCDPAGIVFYPNFLRWTDAASLRFFAAAGVAPWHQRA